MEEEAAKKQADQANIEQDNTAQTNSKEIKVINVRLADSNGIEYKDYEELKEFAAKRGITLIAESASIPSDNNITNKSVVDKSTTEKSNNASDSERSKYKTFEEIRRLRQDIPAEKKIMVIKEISKVLTDIEESKKVKKLIYFSGLQNKPILDPRYKKVGKLKDLVIAGGERFPEVSHLLIVHNGEKLLIPWACIEIFDEIIKINKIYDSIEKRQLKDDDICLGENILDQQVVDVSGLKVIRVNDIALTYIKNKLAVVNIDVGSKAFVRRLGFEKFFDMLNVKFKDHPVPWNSIEPLVGSIEKIHLKVPCPRVSDLHPADVAELFDELSMIERSTILKSMKAEIAAKVLLECESEVQLSIIKSLRPKRLASIFEKMSANDVANIITNLHHDQIDMILNFMTKESAVKIQEVLSYQEGTVARYMDESFITLSPNLTVGTATDYVRSLSKYPTNFHYIYVVDDSDVLIGVLSLKYLVVADANALIKDIMISKVVSVDINNPIEYVEELLTKYNLMALPVVDLSGKIRGIINIDEVLNVLMEKAKNKETFELTPEQRESLKKDKQPKGYYSQLIKDTGQFIKELDTLKPKKKDYIELDNNLLNSK